MKKVYSVVRKSVIALVGFTIIIIGIALLVLPGPGILVIIFGLFILSIEFAWAERHLQTAKKHAQKITKRKQKPDEKTEKD